MAYLSQRSRHTAAASRSSQKRATVFRLLIDFARRRLLLCFSLVRFFASKQTPPVFVWFSSSRLVSGFSSLGVALGHGSRSAASPRFLCHRPRVLRSLFSNRRFAQCAARPCPVASRFSVCSDVAKRAPAPPGALDFAASSRVLRPRARRLKAGLSPRRVTA
jgi:hypothetical protein